jgi:glycosyltransferase involved in cell wall biosynthesis
MNKHPKISIIIPAYNEEDFLPRCLDSIKAQKNAPTHEVIIVDNNSNDATPRIAKRYGARLVSELKPGVVYARNTGLKAAKGEIIVSTDADTYFAENWLATIGEYFDQNPGAAGLAGHYHFVKGPLWAKIWPVMGAVLVKIIYEIFGRTIYVSAANLAFRKKYLAGYNTNHPQGGDETEVVKELSRHGKVHVTLKNAVCTSSRRVNQGFLHSILITVGYYYFFNLWHTKRQGGESVIGSMPVIRTESRTAHWRLLTVQWSAVAILGLTLFSAISHHIPHIWKFSELLHLF